MWRSLFLAIGVYVALLGAEALAIERATIKPRMRNGQMIQPSRVLQPPEYAPWSLMGAGAVIIIYSFTLPKRVTE